MITMLPARLGAALVMLTAWLLRLDWRNIPPLLLCAQQTFPQLSRGWSMGAFSGALSLRLGGGAYYGGQWRTVASVGTDITPPSFALLPRAAVMTLLSFAFALLLCLLSPLIAVLAALLAGTFGNPSMGRFGRRP